MKLVYIGIVRNAEKEKPAVQLCCAKDLTSYGYFTKKTIGEFMTFTSGMIAERILPGTPKRHIKEEGHVFHLYPHKEGVCGVIITDEEYPDRVADGLLNKVCDEFLVKYPRTAFMSAKLDSLTFPELEGYLSKYQDPQNADSIMKIQKELEETKQTLHQTIDSILLRGEKIDNLVAKSDGLSAQSKMFYTQAKKQNSCCVLM